MTNNKTKWEALSLKDKASLMKIFLSQGIQDPKEMKDYYNQFQSQQHSQQNNSFANGGDTNPGMTGMMKARMALANEFGNKAAQRMVSPNPNTYVFTGKENTPTNEKAGNIGTHYIGSYGNIVRPSIQEINGKMEYTGFPSERTNEDIKFETPEDAEYFAEHYKEIAPMMNSFADGGQTNMDEVYAMQRQMNPGLQQQMAQPSRNQGTLAAAPKGTFSKGFDNRTAAQRNADYLNPIKGAAERNAQAYQNGNSVWNGLQTVGETALNSAAATIGAGAVKGVTTAVSKVAPIAGKAIQGAGYLVDTNPLNYLTPTNNVQSTARKVSGVLSAPTLKGMATKTLQTGTKLGTKALYNQAHFALGGPLFNEDNPIEAFGGRQTIPTVRFSAGGKIKKRRKSRC